jgi:Flp pilus assembly protein TadD
MYFYELSEADDEIFANVLLAHDSEYDEQEFLELVLEARDKVMKGFEEESLIEAIATELERRHGFLHVDANLRAAVRVSGEEGETTITAVDERATVPEDDDELRTMLIEVESEDRPYRN